MRFAGILVVGLLGGCSIVFNSGDLPRIADAAVDASPDARPPSDTRVFDVNPNDLTLDSMMPTAILEGTGDAGGRPAVLVVTGSNIDANATLAVVAGSDQVPTQLMVMGTPVVSHDHATIAAPVIVMEIPTLADGDKLSLMVEVTNPGGDAKQLPLEIDGLDPFAPTGTVDVSTLKAQYSSATFASAVHFTDTKGMGPAHVSVTGGITISAVVDVDAGTTGVTPGPGGCVGGTGSVVGGCDTSAGGNGNSGVSGAAGGGGGFANKGSNGTGASGNGLGGFASGEPNLVQLYSYSVGQAGNRGNGGGGGGGATLGTAGLGGGGGGTLELEAGGTITVATGGAVRSGGGAGTKGSGLTPGGDGGGGSGGAILIRSQAAIAATPTDWISAPGGGSGGKGGAGSVGRIRVDAPMGAVASMANNPVAVQGPSWASGASGAPLIVRDPTATVSLIGQSGGSYGIVVNSTAQSPVTLTATTMKDVTAPVAVGHNTVCAVADVNSTSTGHAEALECIDVVYVP